MREKNKARKHCSFNVVGKFICAFCEKLYAMYCEADMNCVCVCGLVLFLEQLYKNWFVGKSVQQSRIILDFLLFPCILCHFCGGA